MTIVTDAVFIPIFTKDKNMYPARKRSASPADPKALAKIALALGIDSNDTAAVAASLRALLARIDPAAKSAKLRAANALTVRAVLDAEASSAPLSAREIASCQALGVDPKVYAANKAIHVRAKAKVSK